MIGGTGTTYSSYGPTELKKAFGWPVTGVNAGKVESINGAFAALFSEIIGAVPAGNDIYLARVQTYLEEAHMLACKAITFPTGN